MQTFKHSGLHGRKGAENVRSNSRLSGHAGAIDLDHARRPIFIASLPRADGPLSAGLRARGANHKESHPCGAHSMPSWIEPFILGGRCCPTPTPLECV